MPSGKHPDRTPVNLQRYAVGGDLRLLRVGMLLELSLCESGTGIRGPYPGEIEARKEARTSMIPRRQMIVPCNVKPGVWRPLMNSLEMERTRLLRMGQFCHGAT